MPVLTEEQAKSNPILKLAAELRRRTYGMCDVGIGPWGYGVNTFPLTKVGTVVRMEPDPYGETPLSPEVKEYTVTLRPICVEQDGVRGDNAIREEELQRLCADPDVMTRLVANALREMSAVPVTVSKQEDIDAFDALYEADQRHTERLTGDEARRLEELRWYETKTPEEIVDLQLSVEKLCMTMERFREAAESVFHHPVTAETLDDCRMELLQERRIMLAVSDCKAHRDEPVIMPQEDAGQAESPQSFGPVLG